MASSPESESLVLLKLIIDAFELTESKSLPSVSTTQSQHRKSSLWFIGRNECNLSAWEPDHSAWKPDHSRCELTLCEWSLQKQIISVTVGSDYNIYTVNSKKEELLCCGFLRESQRIFPFKNNPFYIIPDPVFTLCFRYLEHSEQYWAAGNNQYGQCGVSTVHRRMPLSRIEGLSDILKVNSGVLGRSTLWIKYDGSLYVNGNNRSGQLAMNGTDDICIPILSTFTLQHPELRCVDAASSFGYNVLIADNGSVWFAGDMNYVDWDGGRKFIPLEAPNDLHIASVAAGNDHILFVTQNGSVLSFGGNEFGELGLNQDPEYELSRLQLISFFDENNIKIQSICCGMSHNLALSTDGKVYGWGRNFEGQCGVYDGVNRHEVWNPELIDIGLDIVVRSIICGDYHSGLITMGNEVYLWGSNGYNECCGNMENEEIKEVFTPQNVTDYVLSKSKKDNIVDVFLGWQTTMFLVE